MRSADENKLKTSDQPVDTDKKSGVNAKDRDVGDALRAVYREAVDEQIPDDLLDLLKKLD